MKSTSLFLFSLLALAFLTQPLMHHAFGDETTAEKVQEAKDDAVKETKKGARKLKRKVRNATGHHSTKKDVQDKANDVKDEVNDKVDDVKKKVD